MGIPIGKLALYTACAGIDPAALPAGDARRRHQQRRHCGTTRCTSATRAGALDGQAPTSTWSTSSSTAVQARYPDALIQFEDFLTPNAYALLEKYRDRVLCFNDDIQGTAAVALAGVYASTRITGVPFADLRIMFLGAGSAATGIADLMTAAFVDEGLSLDEARRRLWFVDVNGLVVKSRTDLMAHNLSVRARARRRSGFVDAIDAIKPHVLIGATGAPGTFTQGGHRAHERASTSGRSIFALSNPDVEGRVHRRAGVRVERRPGDLRQRQPVRAGDVRRQDVPAGARATTPTCSPASASAPSRAARARCPTSCSSPPRARWPASSAPSDLEHGALYPPLRDIRQISLAIAVSVAETAYAMKLARAKRPRSLKTVYHAFHVRTVMAPAQRISA